MHAGLCLCCSLPTIPILVFLGDIFLSVYSIFLEILFANSGQPDQTLHFVASDLVLHCSLMPLIWLNTLY